MKKARLIQALAAAAMAGGALAAHADGLYVGGALGGPHYSGDPVSNIGGSGGGTAGKIFGGYQFNPNFGLEGGWFDLGHTEDANGRAKLQGAYFDAVGKIAIAPQWSLTGSAGVAEGRFRTNNGGGDDNSPALKLGVGVEYALSQTTSLNLGYDHYHFIDAFDAKPNVGMPFVGVKVGF